MKFLDKLLHPITLVITAALAIACAVVGIAFSSSPSDYNSMTSMTGHWHQVKNGIPNTKMSADVTSTKINIKLTLGHTTGVFWLGTFDPTVKSKKFTVNSIGDQNAMAFDILASTEPNKDFVYNKGELSYDFSIMGVHTTVVMAKTSDSPKSTPAKYTSPSLNQPSYAAPLYSAPGVKIPVYTPPPMKVPAYKKPPVYKAPKVIKPLSLKK